MGIQTKHFFNNPSHLVLESLQGLCAINPSVALDTANKVIYLKELNQSKVALICGGGSGHEPAHSGFVGEGMLTAAVCGNVFASPGSSQVRWAIDLVDNEKGTLIIVKNYTGDVLNFGLAKEQYAALHPEKADRVKFIVVGDDAAVGRTQGSIVGRRGLAGTVLVYKIAGALAGLGVEFEKVYKTAEWVANNLATIGVGLDHCHVPGTAVAESQMKEGEIEIGLGIHNESGNRRVSPIPSLHDLVQQLLDPLLSTSDPERSFLPLRGEGDEVVLMLNNLGGVSELELGSIVREVQASLVERQIKVLRVLSGSFMTSLNMPGFSITLLLLPTTSSPGPISSELLLDLLDRPTSAPGWKRSSGQPPPPIIAAQEAPRADVATRELEGKAKLRAADPGAFDAAIERVCRALNAAEPEITRMDSIAGDGDCGLTLQAGATAVLQELKEGNAGCVDIIGTALAVSNVAADKMGGTSGALYSIFFSALAQGLQAAAATGKTDVITQEAWAQALASALRNLYTYTRARPPSRTLVDPLAAFVDTLSSNPNDLRAAVTRAAEAAENTRDVEAKAGRSAYVEGDRLKSERVPDPGAWGIKVLLEAIVGV